MRVTPPRRPIHPRWGIRLRYDRGPVRGPVWQVTLYLGPLTWWTAIQRVRPKRQHRHTSPAARINALRDVLELSRLAMLIGTTTESLRRYQAGEVTPPNLVARRVAYLAQLVAILAGSYNDIGIRRWFHRPHPHLGRRAPAELLSGDWDPDDPGARAVLDAARRLLA